MAPKESGIQKQTFLPLLGRESLFYNRKKIVKGKVGG